MASLSPTGSLHVNLFVRNVVDNLTETPNLNFGLRDICNSRLILRMITDVEDGGDVSSKFQVAKCRFFPAMMAAGGRWQRLVGKEVVS
ncbi:hypothetical protein AgCh_008489 [Apium graveolens]